eukprot:1146333-Pelagomonas_calceolata.AAC.4
MKQHESQVQFDGKSCVPSGLKSNTIQLPIAASKKASPSFNQLHVQGPGLICFQQQGNGCLKQLAYIKGAVPCESPLQAQVQVVAVNKRISSVRPASCNNCCAARSRAIRHHQAPHMCSLPAF